MRVESNPRRRAVVVDGQTITCARVSEARKLAGTLNEATAKHKREVRKAAAGAAPAAQPAPQLMRGKAPRVLSPRGRPDHSRLDPPPFDYVFPLWEWTEALESKVREFHQAGHQWFDFMERFRTGKCLHDNNVWGVKGDWSSWCLAPDASWLLPNPGHSWERLLERCFANDTETAAPGTHQGGACGYHVLKNEGLTINGNPDRGNDCWLANPQDNAASLQRFLPEFRLLGRTVRYDGRSKWTIDTRLPLREHEEVSLDTVPGNPTIEYVAKIGWDEVPLINTSSIFGRISDSHPRRLEHIEALEALIRRVEMAEWAQGLAEQPEWVDWK